MTPRCQRNVINLPDGLQGIWDDEFREFRGCFTRCANNIFFEL
jgi:hypothetical protein